MINKNTDNIKNNRKSCLSPMNRNWVLEQSLHLHSHNWTIMVCAHCSGPSKQKRSNIAFLIIKGGLTDKYKQETGPTETRTCITGFRVPSVEHYTIGPSCWVKLTVTDWAPITNLIDQGGGLIKGSLQEIPRFNCWKTATSWYNIPNLKPSASITKKF